MPAEPNRKIQQIAGIAKRIAATVAFAAAALSIAPIAGCADQPGGFFPTAQGWEMLKHQVAYGRLPVADPGRFDPSAPPEVQNKQLAAIQQVCDEYALKATADDRTKEAEINLGSAIGALGWEASTHRVADTSSYVDPELHIREAYFKDQCMKARGVPSA
jgi:hypothetical protein